MDPPSLTMVGAAEANCGFSLKSKNRTANTVDPDKSARYLDPHCLHNHLFWSVGLKGLLHVSV